MAGREHSQTIIIFEIGLRLVQSSLNFETKSESKSSLNLFVNTHSVWAWIYSQSWDRTLKVETNSMLSKFCEYGPSSFKNLFSQIGLIKLLRSLWPFKVISHVAYFQATIVLFLQRSYPLWYITVDLWYYVVKVFL